MGYPNHSSANLHYGKFARLVGTRLKWRPLPEVVLGVLVTFEKPLNEWHWIMRPAVARAIEELGWVSEDQPVLPEEVVSKYPLVEGALRQITVNAYERNPVARAQCIRHHGCRCAACGVALVEQYGEAAQGLVHVHHLRQLATRRRQTHVDPVKDLRPVCPNCHAVIHSRARPYSISEIAAMVTKAQS